MGRRKYGYRLRKNTDNVSKLTSRRSWRRGKLFKRNIRRGTKVITLESLMSIDRNDLQEASKTIDKNDLPLIIDWLSEKDDKIRYQALLLLQKRSLYFDDVYPFWEIFVLKLKSSNSYQRSIGLMLIAENTKWDKDNRFDRLRMNTLLF